MRFACAAASRDYHVLGPFLISSLRLAMFHFQQVTGPIDQVSQLVLETEHSALPFADFAQWASRISGLNFAGDFDESRFAQFG